MECRGYGSQKFYRFFYAIQRAFKNFAGNRPLRPFSKNEQFPLLSRERIRMFTFEIESEFLRGRRSVADFFFRRQLI